MATQVPPKRGVAFSFEVSLGSQTDTDIFQTSVTLAAGDVVVYKDGALDGNIDALPVEIGTSGVLTVSLSADEMNADRVLVLFHDAADDEWQDAVVTIHTVTTSQIDDLATASALTTVDANVDSILADTGTDGVVLANDAITAAKIAADAIGSSELAATAAQEIADAILVRGVSNVEDSADATSLAALILGAFESVISGSTWTIYKTDHSTTFTTRTVTTSGSANPIIEVT
uniref:Uncharacterized protein n=1 Tax=viral metagenome TaxID=1070528 RepID=A0A6M3KPM4_9ZZZZ